MACPNMHVDADMKYKTCFNLLESTPFIALSSTAGT